MNQLQYLKSLTSTIIIIILLVPALSMATGQKKNQYKIDFWQHPKKGANIFNIEFNVDDIKAAKDYGIEFIRLSPDKFHSTHRDFLIGDADNYSSLVAEDLSKLKQILDDCYEQKMPVIITMVSLPGSRWKQNNNNQDDLRIWTESKYQEQASYFWQHLSSELKDHPAIMGYNILNEPHPERIFDEKSKYISALKQDEVQAMLYDFYTKAIKAIRLEDKTTPIILDSSAYADAKTFDKFRKHDDDNIIYSFHMYEPFEYTNYKLNQQQYEYPGEIDGKYWHLDEIQKYLSVINAFQMRNNIPSSKILVGEFGGHRMSLGLEKYFQDLITIFQNNKWHFAFYAFREDAWDGMDYELGEKKLPWSYWESQERGEKPTLNRRNNYPPFLIIKNSLNAN